MRLAPADRPRAELSALASAIRLRANGIGNTVIICWEEKDTLRKELLHTVSREVPLRIRFLNWFPVPSRQRRWIMPSLQSDPPHILDECQPVRDVTGTADVLFPGEPRLADSFFSQALQIGRRYSALGAGKGLQEPHQLIANGHESRLQSLGGKP